MRTMENKNAYTSSTPCKHCTHMAMTHVHTCFVKGCKCPGYEPKEKK